MFNKRLKGGCPFSDWQLKFLTEAVLSIVFSKLEDFVNKIPDMVDMW